ncbi:MAG: PilZ domain-containing protein [Planctomycetota bacterium]
MEKKATEASRADADQLSPGHQAEGELRQHFSGKRDGHRTFKFIDLEVAGREGAFQGLGVDMSRTGILLRVLDPAFASPEETANLMAYSQRVGSHFEGGLTVRFRKCGLSVEGDVVRVTQHGDGNRGFILLGVRFHRQLTQSECLALSVDPSDDRPPPK